jgi:hypothetical protein
MKKKIFFGSLAVLAIAGGIIYAADHIDAPAVTGSGSTSLGSDITDIYAFQSPSDNTKMVFVMNVQGLMSPAVSAAATFPSNVLYELNIDNTGDNVEDLVIQAKFQDGKFRVYGPVAPASTGTSGAIVTTGAVTEGTVTAYSASPNITTGSTGIKVFAGPRDDPFFFDLVRFKEIVAGTATVFHAGTAGDPANDTFKGTNVMSIVVEVPKSMLGSAASINVWGETKSK